MKWGSGFLTSVVIGCCLAVTLSGCARRGLSLRGGWNLEVGPALGAGCEAPAGQGCVGCAAHGEGAVEGSACGGAGCGTCVACLRPGRMLLRQIGRAVTAERYFDRPHFHPVPTQPAFMAQSESYLAGSGQPPLETDGAPPESPLPNAPLPKSGPGVLVPEPVPEAVPAPLPTPMSPAPMPPGNTGWRLRGGVSSTEGGSDASWVFGPPVLVGANSGAQAQCVEGCGQGRIAR